MILNRNKNDGPDLAASRPSAAAEDVRETLPDAEVPEEITAAAERCRAAAEQAQQRSGNDRGEAETVLAGARAEAARIMAEAEARAQILSKSATAAATAAERSGEHARWLASAAAAAIRAQEAGALAQKLADERDRLERQVADDTQRAEQLRAEHAGASASLAEATSRGDIEAMTEHRGRVGSLAALAESLTARKSAAQERLAEIGDGTETPLTHARLPELAAAEDAERQGRAEVRRILNAVYPERPEAIADAARAELRACLEANAERIRQESAPPRPRTVVVR